MPIRPFLKLPSLSQVMHYFQRFLHISSRSYLIALFCCCLCLSSLFMFYKDGVGYSDQLLDSGSWACPSRNCLMFQESFRFEHAANWVKGICEFLRVESPCFLVKGSPSPFLLLEDNSICFQSILSTLLCMCLFTKEKKGESKKKEKKKEFLL